MNAKIHILCITLAILFAGCIKEDGVAKDWSKEINLLVSHEFVDYRPFGAEAPLKGINTREEGSNIWTSLHKSGISGFSYEEGYEYNLRVLKTHLGNPPMDGSNIRYKLINIISRTKIEHEPSK